MPCTLIEAACLEQDGAQSAVSVVACLLADMAEVVDVASHPECWPGNVVSMEQWARKSA